MLDGIDLSSWSEKPTDDSYGNRLQKVKKPIWKFLENLYPYVILTNQGVYTELGIKLGANLIFELLKSNPLKEQVDEEDNKER